MADEKKSERLDAFKPNLTCLAIGMFQEEGTNNWHVAKFMFDPKTGVTGKMEIYRGGEGKDMGREVFKIVAGNDILG